MYSRLRSEVRCLASSLATSFPYWGAIGIALLLLESSSIRDAMRRELPGALNHREGCEAAGRRLRLLRTPRSNPSSSHHPVLSYLLVNLELRPKSRVTGLHYNPRLSFTATAISWSDPRYRSVV
jgi:hypothetical protein